MIITIDGPTASGKSTIARLLAEQLGFMHLNSGLLFRAGAYALMKKHVVLGTLSSLTLEDARAVFKDHSITYEYDSKKGPQIFLDGTEITPLLKTAEVDHGASVVATQPAFRQAVLEYIRILADENNVIADGRDCGTIMFPQAAYKFYITAELPVRAQRWIKDQAHHNKHYSLEQAEKIVADRDRRDSERAIAPLKPADDAIIVDTSHMTIQEVLTNIVEVINT